MTFMTAAGLSSPLIGRGSRHVRAIAFDAFVLFDPRAIVTRAREIAREKGEALVAAASAKLFAYTWLYTSAGRYASFDSLTADAFRSSAQGQGIELSSADVEYLVDAYSNLGIWPDVPPALEALRNRGIRMAMLSNLPERALRANLRAGQIDRQFDFVLSTDRARQFKPSPKAYQLAVRAYALPASRIGFAASAGWDAAGATWFGYPTVWVNRGNQPREEAHVRPNLETSGMDGVLRLAG